MPEARRREPGELELAAAEPAPASVLSSLSTGPGTGPGRQLEGPNAASFTRLEHQNADVQSCIVEMISPIAGRRAAPPPATGPVAAAPAGNLTVRPCDRIGRPYRPYEASVT